MGGIPGRKEILIETDDLATAHAIRREVFVAEQDVSEAEEMDDLDDRCRHYVARVAGCPAATARLRPYGRAVCKIERMAVRAAHRNSGVGRALIERIEADAAADGVREIVLHAQDHALGFYARCGYSVEGEGFEEAGIPHHRMSKKLTTETQRHRGG
jgi:predicted GNAT family N-acyltransferase